ncbi:MAG: transporter [Myxococcota bacterium]
MRRISPRSSSKRRRRSGLPLSVALVWTIVSGALAASGRDAEPQGDRPPSALATSVGPGDEVADELESERDSFTPATAVVGRGRSVVEAAYSFLDNRHGDDSHSFPELLTRVGVFDRVELRLGWNYEMGGGGSVSSSGSSSEGEDEEESKDEGRVLYGLKFLVSKQRAWIPQSSLIVQAWTPTSGPSDTTTFMGAYVFGWKMRNDWVLDAALRFGTAEEEGDHYRELAPSVVLKVPVLERWNAHVEYFAVVTQDRMGDVDKHYVTPGVHYLLTPDLEIGVRVGAGLNDDSGRFFTNAGLAMRF